MIKQIPLLLVLVGIVVIIIGFNLVTTYGLSFYTGIALFFGIAMIVSGINHGSNAATNVIYSGTMSAAVEGAMENIPSIGFSLDDFDHDADFEPTKHFAKLIMKKALSNDFPISTCLNVNVPKLPLKTLKGVKICRQAMAFWEDRFDERKDPLGKKYYWLTGEFKDQEGADDTDMSAIKNGFVSVVPVQFDMTAHHAIPQLKKWKL